MLSTEVRSLAGLGFGPGFPALSRELLGGSLGELPKWFSDVFFLRVGQYRPLH